MELCKVRKKRLIHKVIPRPPIVDQRILVTGREGIACNTDFGMLFMVKKFKGAKEDITCKKCLALT